MLCEVVIVGLAVALVVMILVCLRAHAELEAMRLERNMMARDLKAFHKMLDRRPRGK